ncbi:expressed unknown protein [Seminavis robusta]|uniref:Uncharacterized protein n=1 Tax=Seminavis robusta TaxID=568900 RepID=A0A9N8H725_9STRA|nr:expressed unknown protein [Seminavis robusta]|eukprot:Sro129_g061440.1 n/a (233) ;mRNA; r:9287-9985
MQTSGHSTLADKIATEHKHSTIEDMVADDNIREELVEWRMQSGLTVDELVLIQPTYQYQFRYESRQARSARRRFLAIIAKMQQLVEELKASAPEGAISYGDVPDAVVKDLEEDIRKFAFTFRNGNISKYYGGAASPYDVIPHWGWTLIESTGMFPRTRRSPMGWTVGDMKDFNKQIDAFEATLPSSGCEQVRMLVGKLRHAASGKRNPEHSLYVDDDSEYEDIEYDCTSGRS